MERIAPIFAVRDLDAAMEHYRRLGFTVRAYAGGGYGYAFRDGIEIHLGVVPGDVRIIFLDEPTTGLDPRGRRTMWQIIRDLVDRGITILPTTLWLIRPSSP